MSTEDPLISLGGPTRWIDPRDARIMNDMKVRDLCILFAHTALEVIRDRIDMRGSAGSRENDPFYQGLLWLCKRARELGGVITQPPSSPGISPLPFDYDWVQEMLANQDTL